MSKRTDKGNKGGGLGTADFQLWRAFTRDIEPLTERDWDAQEQRLRIEEKQKTASSESKETVSFAAPAREASKPKNDHPPQIDARTDQRLKRGQMPIEGKLDLHGHNQERAY